MHDTWLGALIIHTQLLKLIKMPIFTDFQVAHGLSDMQLVQRLI